ncbi:hypothetical protein C6501_05150 [Candidatus Poribacteria bacterium]|nr:MAG: hypothetical protein C6501_05150 [Candidatus Poribacteria bacterium]
MNKKVVVITLFLTTLFAVGGVILHTHGEGSRISIGGFSYMNFDEGWSLSVDADATESGANAYASPRILDSDSIIEAATEDGTPINITGYASTYVTIYYGNDGYFGIPDVDAGPILARLIVAVWTEKTVTYTDQGFPITTFTTKRSGVAVAQGRGIYKGGGKYDAKDSGVCGNLGPYSHFSDFAEYRYTP